MKSQGWIVGALVAAGVVFAMRGCLNQKEPPDEQLAERFDAMCKIGRANVDTPVRGVKKLGHYLDKHAGDLLGEWGDTLATIERISDDAKHDARARVAKARLAKPLHACEQDWRRFAEAVENNAEASALVQRFSERLNRTFEIIFSGAPIDLRHLPEQIEQQLSAI